MKITVLACSGIEDYRGYEIHKQDENEYAVFDSEENLVDSFETSSDAEHYIDNLLDTSTLDSKIAQWEKDEEYGNWFRTRMRKFHYSGPVYVGKKYVGETDKELETTSDSLDNAYNNFRKQLSSKMNQDIRLISIDKSKIKDDNSMKHQIDKVDAATYKKYNANSSGNFSPDCVKRAISMAFNIPYVKVGQGLNQMMHEKRRSEWNIRYVYEPYMKSLGCDDPVPPEEQMTVFEFADKHPTGTYVLETSSKPAKMFHGNHLTCVIDNVLYDSWDSSNQYVCSVYRCNNSRHVELSDIQDHWKELADFATEEIEKLAIKQIEKNKDFHTDDIDPDLIDFEVMRSVTKGYTLYEKCMFFIENNDKVSLNTKFDVAFVFTPETTVEEAKKIISDTAKVRIYDRFYAINKMWKSKLEEAEVEKEMTEAGLKPNDVWLFDGREKRFYNSLPSKIKPRVTRVSVYWPGQYSYSYELTFKPLPGDPRTTPVELEGYTADDIRTELDRYMNNNYERIYKDYSGDEIF